jgi:hypothetical protein
MPDSHPKVVLDSINVNYSGANKYYTVVGLSKKRYHADKHCSHLRGKKVKRVESHQLATHANMCDECTTESTEVGNIVEKTKYR